MSDTRPDPRVEFTAKFLFRLAGLWQSDVVPSIVDRRWNSIDEEDRQAWCRKAVELLAALDDLSAPSGGAPAPADEPVLREELLGAGHPAWPDPLTFMWGDDPRANAARWLAENGDHNPRVRILRRVQSEWETVDPATVRSWAAAVSEGDQT